MQRRRRGDLSSDRTRPATDRRSPGDDPPRSNRRRYAAGGRSLTNGSIFRSAEPAETRGERAGLEDTNRGARRIVRRAVGKRRAGGRKRADDDGDSRIKWGTVYGSAGAIGFAPTDVKRWSLWEYFAVIDGWKRANGIEDPVEPPTAEEYYDMRARAGW